MACFHENAEHQYDGQDAGDRGEIAMGLFQQRTIITVIEQSAIAQWPVRATQTRIIGSYSNTQCYQKIGKANSGPCQASYQCDGNDIFKAAYKLHIKWRPL